MTGVKLMGVINITPDSFSDGGQFLSVDAALRHAEALISDGADILDIGAESSRPGAVPLSIQEEIDRLTPFYLSILLILMSRYLLIPTILKRRHWVLTMVCDGLMILLDFLMIKK